MYPILVDIVRLLCDEYADSFTQEKLSENLINECFIQ